MRKPRTTIEKFSTFLDVQENSSYSSSWLSIPKLEQSMSASIKENQDITEEAWSQYWLTRALQDGENSLAQAHLAAYLEETCFCVAIALVRRFPQGKLDWRDCFQDARVAVAKPDKLFRSYDPNKSSVRSYAQQRLDSIVKDAQIAIGARSKAGLLRSLSEKRLRENLEIYGIREPKLAIYVLAWRCYVEIYTPTTAKRGQSLPLPSPEWLDKIAQRYNQLRLPLGINSALAGADILVVLEECALVSRKRYTNTLLPLSFTAQNESDAIQEVPDPKTLDTMEKIDRDRDCQKVREFLLSAFASLSSEAQLILRLYHGLCLNQSDIANVMQMNGISISQSTISRQISKWEKKLLQDLVAWSLDNLNKCQNSEQNHQVSKQLDIWLTPYCREPLDLFLSLKMQQELLQELDLIRHICIERENPQKVAKQFDLTTTDVKARALQGLLTLQTSLKQHLEREWQIVPHSLDVVERSIDEYVRAWLNR
jgi:RNA polymerase sigma factor (sigma-70 family)